MVIILDEWLHSMENSASPPLGDKTNTTDGGNQNKQAITIFNSIFYII
jgi:hypothetical protein